MPKNTLVKKILEYKILKLKTGETLIAKIPVIEGTGQIAFHKNENGYVNILMVSPQEIRRNSFTLNSAPMNSIELRDWIFPTRDLVVPVERSEVISICNPTNDMIEFYNNHILELNFINQQPELAGILYNIPVPNGNVIKHANDVEDELIDSQNDDEE